MPAPDFVGIDVQGLAQLQAYLKGLPKAAQDSMVDAVSKTMLDILRLYPSYGGGVTRQEAYGVSFFTDKQRKWFFANLDNLSIPYNRTQSVRNSWRQEGTGARSFLVNDRPHAAYLYDESAQSRHAAKIGWQKLSAIIAQHIKRIEQVAQAAVKRATQRRY